MQKIKVNDEVVVTVGKDKGKKGKVLKIDHKNSRVLVQGINVVKKSLKATQQNPNGGITEKELAIHISNVALLSPKTKKATRVKITSSKDGKRVRVAASCGTQLDK